MKVFFLLSIVALATSLPLKEEWEDWKREHGKQYADDLEESIRHAIWFQSYHHIQEHNKREDAFKLGLNEFSDLVRTSALQVCSSISKCYFSSHSLDSRAIQTEVPPPC